MRISTEQIHAPFKAILEGTDAHRNSHGCSAFPFQDGCSLAVVAAATKACRVLELGTTLGYTACWFAHGSTHAVVDTIARDFEHVRLARTNIAEAGFSSRIAVHHGEFNPILETLQRGYDIAFFDGYAPTLTVLRMLEQMLRPGGVLISANLSLSGGDSQKCVRALCDPARWLTSFVAEGGRTAISVLR